MQKYFRIWTVRLNCQLRKTAESSDSKLEISDPRELIDQVMNNKIY